MPNLITAKHLAEIKARMEAHRGIPPAYAADLIATLERAVELLDRAHAVGTLGQALGSTSELNDSPWVDISEFLKEFDHE